jgi:hypothetical protein
MSIFTCCERADETKYFHTCGCPSASFTCESNGATVVLCGFSEYVYSGATPPIEASVPPRKYLIETIFNSDFFNYKFFSGECEGQTRQSSSASWSKVDVYGTNPCSFTSGTVTPATRSTDYYTCEDGLSTFSYTATNTNIATKPSDSNTVSNTFRESIYREPGQDRVVTRRSTLSSEDTESTAIQRTTLLDGSSCSSIWQTRSTEFSFDYTTSEYTIECSDLIVGFEYEVTPSIRKRTVVIGSYGPWEDVTVSASTFTATSDTKSFAAVALGHIQGYEYEITGVTIEKT